MKYKEIEMHYMLGLQNLSLDNAKTVTHRLDKRGVAEL